MINYYLYSEFWERYLLGIGTSLRLNILFGRRWIGPVLVAMEAIILEQWIMASVKQ
jgi:hypothetical protein